VRGLAPYKTLTCVHILVVIIGPCLGHLGHGLFSLGGQVSRPAFENRQILGGGPVIRPTSVHRFQKVVIF